MTEKIKKKRKLPPVIISRKTHIGCFLYLILAFLIFIYYSIINQEINFIFLLSIITFGLAQYFFLYKGKRIILTDKKIYVYIRGKKFLSLPLTDGFTHISYSQNKLGKFFNYGTLNISTVQKTLFSYYFLNDCIKVYNKILEQHINEMKKIDPNYKMEYYGEKEREEKSEDVIDTLKEDE